ncbi:MAG: hydrogenase expression/formation protein HypE [Firmicutes bacterium]|nr:hydrogenase expression/formation protein HypE [Bacillota bacterium]
MKNDTILLAHGSGGKLSRKLITELFMPHFTNEYISPLADAALIDGSDLWRHCEERSDAAISSSAVMTNKKLAFTTDSFVVKPIFFPGGDIGKLAVCGTTNDLAVMGAKPLYLSCGFVLEEGLLIDELHRILDSMAAEAEKNGVKIVTGDTKVVEKGSADKIFINTAGIGIRDNNRSFNEKIKPGDKVIINGTLGDHGIAVLSARENLAIGTPVLSDCASLWHMIDEVLESSNGVKFMRDPTRGGLATVLNEIVHGENFGILLHEDSIPVKEEVNAICELLGFDPLYLANEGKVVLIASEKEAGKIVSIMKKNEIGKDSRIIGEVAASPAGKVFMKTGIGGTRIVDMMIADQLPRIC